MANTNFGIPTWLEGLPLDAEKVFEFKANFDFTIPPSLAGTKVTVGTNPTATAVYNVNKNGSSIGTISIATDGTVTLGGAGASFSAVSNDVYSLTAPTPADATLSDVSVNVLATIAG